MHRNLRSLILACLALLPVAATRAQTSNVVYGRTALTFSTTFQQAISGQATLTDLDGNPLQANTLNLTIAAGTFSLSTAQGELIHRGGLVATGSGVTVRIQNLIMDSSNLAAPVITAAVVVNGVYAGRQTLFNVQVPATFTLPLPVSNSAVQENGLVLTLAPSASVMLNRMFGNVTAAGESIGTANIYSVLSSTPLTDR